MRFFNTALAENRYVNGNLVNRLLVFALYSLLLITAFGDGKFTHKFNHVPFAIVQMFALLILPCNGLQRICRHHSDGIISLTLTVVTMAIAASLERQAM